MTVPDDQSPPPATEGQNGIPTAPVAPAAPGAPAAQTTNPDFGAKTTAAEAAAAFSKQIRGKIILITGPSLGGIGYETALVIARHQPCHLLLAGRDTSRLEAAASSIRRALRHRLVLISTIELNLASLSSVRAAAQQIKNRITLAHPKRSSVDVLINNAGIMMTPYQLTDEGHESQFATNHLGPWLLTALLKPKRAVFMSSIAHRTCPIREQPFNEDKYNPYLGYAQSKTAAILSAIGFSSRGIPSVSLHPGVIRTNLGRYITEEDLKGHLGRWFDSDGMMKPDSGFEFKTLKQGAATSIVAAFDESLGGGEYLEDCKVAPVVGPTWDMSEMAKGGVARHAVDKAEAERLWAMTEKMTGESFYTLEWPVRRRRLF